MNKKVMQSCLSVALCTGLLAGGASASASIFRPAGSGPEASPLYKEQQPVTESHKVAVFVEKMTAEEKMLFQAIEQENLPVIEELIKSKKVDLNTNFTDYNGTPLYYAIGRPVPNYDLLMLLIRNGADIRGSYDRHGMHRSYLVEAAGRGDVQLLDFVQSWGVEINDLDGTDDTNGFLNALQKNILTQTEPDGITPEQLAMAKHLLEKGIFVNHEDNLGNTALLSAAYITAQHPTDTGKEMLLLLKNAGADTTVRNHKGKNVLDILTDSGNLELSAFWLEATK